MLRVLLLATASTLGPALAVMAQEPGVQRGTRVRLVTNQSGATLLQGRLIGSLSDRLLVAFDAQRDTVVIPLASVRQFAIREHRSAAGSIAKYAGLGLAFGAAAGALVGPLVTSSDCLAWNKTLEHQSKCVGDLFDADQRARSALVFAGVGTIIGAVVGRVVGSDRWKEISPDRVRVAVRPASRSLAVSTSMPF